MTRVVNELVIQKRWSSDGIYVPRASRLGEFYIQRVAKFGYRQVKSWVLIQIHAIVRPFSHSHGGLEGIDDGARRRCEILPETEPD